MLRKTMRRIDRYFSQFEDWMLFLTVTIALVTAMANVILRKATNDLNLYWSDEIVRKVIFFSTYFGALAAVRQTAVWRADPRVFDWAGSQSTHTAAFHGKRPGFL